MELRLNLNCNGKVNSNDWELNSNGLLLRGEVENVLYPQEDCMLPDEDIQIFDYNVSPTTILFDLKHFIKCMDMQLKILSRHESYSQMLNSNTTDTDFYYIRCTVSQFILFLRAYLNSMKFNYSVLQVINNDIEEEFNMLFIVLKQFFQRLYNIPDATFHFVPSKIGNECKQPEYHMYHMHIELRWFFISLTYIKYLCSHYTLDSQLEIFENAQTMVINDFIYISLKIFEAIPLQDMQQKTSFNCTCIRELWLMLQIFTDSLSDRIKSMSFWECINEGINKLLNNTVSDIRQKPFRFCKYPELFCFWLIYHLSLLYGYNSDGIFLGPKSTRIKPNYEQLEIILKKYASKGGGGDCQDEIDDELRVIIPLLNTILGYWKQPKVSIISLLWDCFHKRLNKPFLLQVSGPWALSLERKTVADILKYVKDRIHNIGCVKESSYGMFLSFLGSFLHSHYTNTETKYWNQIKGRIYSKFSKNKVNEFSTSGIYNFISLFLTMAVTADTVNVCSVMLDLLPATKEYNSTNSKTCILIWKGKLAILALYAEFKLSMTNIAPIYVDTINTICSRKDDTSRTLMSNFVDVFSTILSSTSVALGEYLLIDGWIDRYLVECPNKTVGILTSVLLNVFERCISLAKTTKTGNISHMIDALWCYVACRVRQLVFNPTITNEHYKNITRLAVMFTLEALKHPETAKRHGHSVVSLFQHFAASIVIKDIKVTRRYVMQMLQHEETICDLKKVIKNFDTMIVQAWVKCSIIGRDTNDDEIKVLQNYILQLNEIQEIFLSSDDIQEFQNSKEPILLFMMLSMKKRNTLKTEQERFHYDVRWRSYFNLIEKWILIPITEETWDSELALWIYKCIGTLILCNSVMLYSKNQPNNMFKILLNKTILSEELTFLKNLGKKTFPMIILGIENLQVKSDISLQVLIRDLFNQYLPYLVVPNVNTSNYKVSDSLLKCFKDAKLDFVSTIFEILINNFFIITTDNMIHKHATLIIDILDILLKDDQNYGCHIVECIIVTCTPCVIECYVKVHERHFHKQQTIQFIMNITKNSHYKESAVLQDKFQNVILTAIKKSIAINQNNTFEFLRAMLKVTSDTVKFLLPHLSNILNYLEMNQRPNAASFRYLWNQLQSLIKNTSRNY